MTAVVGTAGWSIPRKDAERFASEGTSLQRYAGLFRGIEINSSFHRPHRRSTWAKWGQDVPEGFRFSVKIPKTITHGRKLIACEDLVAAFFDEVEGLGEKLAILLVQLPPKLAFDPGTAGGFFQSFRPPAPARIACEPRHPSWFEPEADALLRDLEIARVAADPAIVAAAAVPGGWRGMSYWRLHGSPDMYRSAYGERLAAYAEAIRADLAKGRETWCMFDNTAASEATGDALALQDLLGDELAGA